MIETPVQNGFTLVELLFALVAGSLLLVALGWAVGGLERQLRRTDTVTSLDQVEALTPFLDATVAEAYPPTRGAVLAGDAHTLTVTVPPPQALGPLGPVRLSLSVDTSASGTALIARLTTVARGPSLPPAAMTPHVLAQGFKAIRFEYLRGRGDPPGRMPRLITILFTAPDGTILPLGLEPRLAADADCVFDPISLACRP